MTNKLYELAGEFLAVAAKLDAIEDGGEIPAELERELDAVSMAFEAKVESLCKWRADLEARASVLRAEADQHRAEADRLDRQTRTMQNRADWVKSYLFNTLLATGNRKFQAGTFKLSVCRNSKASVNLIGDKIPRQFVRVVEEFDRDKARETWATVVNRRAKLAEEFPAITPERLAELVPFPDCVRVIHGEHLRIS